MKIDETNLEVIFTDHIAVRARAGADRSACVREAFLLALAHNVRVILTHSDLEYVCNPLDVLRLALSPSEVKP